MESRLSHVVAELKDERMTTISRLQQLDSALGALRVIEPLMDIKSPALPKKAKRHISPEGLARIRAAARRRWAKAKRRPAWAQAADARVAKKVKRYKGLHWTQKPENKTRLKRHMAKMQRERQRMGK